jgi:site-specific DNA recombinase
MGDGVILRRTIKRSGARLFFFAPFPQEIRDDGQLGLLNIVQDYASQQYVENLREASMRGLRGKVEAGIHHQGHAPYGYRVEGKKREAHLVIVEEQARIIRLVFRWYALERLALPAIVERLDNLCLPTPGELKGYHRQRGARQWSQTIIYRILRETSYIGEYQAFRTQRIRKDRSGPRDRDQWISLPAPRIIEDATWQLAQQRMANHGDHARHVHFDYLMRRRLKCTCQYSVQGRPSRRKSGRRVCYYHCTSIEKDRVRGRCGLPHFRVDQVDYTVWEFVKELLSNPEMVLLAYREAQTQQITKHMAIHEQIAICDEQIIAYNNELNNLIDMRRHTNVQSLRDRLDRQADDIATMIDTLTKKRAQLGEQLSAETITDEQIASLAESLRDIVYVLEEADQDFSIRRGLIEDLNITATLRVDEHGEKWVVIHWLDRNSPHILKTSSAQPHDSVTPAPPWP